MKKFIDAMRRLARKRELPPPGRAGLATAPPGQVIVYSTDDGDIMIDDQGCATCLSEPRVEEERLTAEQVLSETADLEQRISELHKANEMMKRAYDRYEAAYRRVLTELPRMTRVRREKLEADLRRIFAA